MAKKKIMLCVTISTFKLDGNLRVLVAEAYFP